MPAKVIGATPLLAHKVQIELLRWNDPQRPVPCSFLRKPQNDVASHTGDPGNCDRVIGLFRPEVGGGSVGRRQRGPQWVNSTPADTARWSCSTMLFVYSTVTVGPRFLPLS